MNKLACTVLCGVLLSSPFSFSAAVTGKISGDRLQWFSGNDNGEFLVSTRFDRIGGLPRTAQWFPGTFSTSTSKTLTLTSETGEVISVPAVLAGTTYQLTGGFTEDTVPPVAPICSESILGAQTTVIDRGGNFCVASKSAKYKNAVEPFNQYQPILKLERSTLIKAFEGKPTGTYSGVISGILRYGFYVNATDSALTYRNIPVTFSVQLRHIGSYISNITVLGTGHIVPKYDTYNHTAEGGTGYKVTASGAFETGIRFRFTGKDDNDYTLKPMARIGSAKAVPYSVSCNKCTPGTLLVEDGILQHPDSWIKIEETGKSVSFDLNISYQDVKAEDVVDGTYRDSFTLMLEVIL
ncbi:hypothetical protein ACEV8A_14125 [Vibrio parahaemolyticus]|nr:hypothetical protein [Vibrio parahaemolyticus]QLK49755.1 hypothetical protein DR996_32760 [Vibrio owensii]MBE3817041.1 hypothetical protein [Vibrio parahaemolyticus]MCR9723108.1 hypothetical protein [Vibrio parahaemolyticus]MCR9741381.1 hypothetical protein [Vibrio parahaemolyticus]MDG2996588.1 hypothetical protein [Vibrio parahaemolyticus]